MRFLIDYTNRSKKLMLSLCSSIVIGLIFITIGCIFLISNGKHDIVIYQTIAFVLLGIMFGIIVFINLIVELLETTDDLEKKIQLKKLDLEFEKLTKKE